MAIGYRISKQHKAVLLPFNPAVQSIIPHAETIEHNGRNFHLVPHRNTETKLLNNLGVKVPAPILHHYDWCNTTPFESQKDTARLMTDNRRAYVLNDMGTGKTRAALYATDFMMKTEEIGRVLIVAPLSTLTTVWEKEIFECFPHRTAVTLHGAKAKRLSLLNGDFDYYIINHDGLRVLEQELKDRTDINAVVIDELAILRNSKSKRWKVANRIMQTKQYVWGMTGSPTPKEPTDAYGQAKLLTPEHIPKFYTAFKNSVMYQVAQFRWLPRKEANDVVHDALQPAVRYSREDCIDLPPTTYSTREVLLTAAQKAAYKQMMEEYVVSYESGDISAANAGVRASKLVQIGAGFTYGRDGVVVDLDCDPRINELVDILNETEQKVIVFTPFKHSVDTLYNMLQLALDMSVARIHGDVTKGERDKTFNLFQNSSSPRVLVAHPQTMAHGLTLTAANTIVWFSPTWDLEIYEQANARITRPSQKHHTHIIHIQATKTEKRIYDTLTKRGNMQSALLGLFKGDRQ